MSDDMDMDMELEHSPEEISDAEYNDILGLEGMEEGDVRDAEAEEEAETVADEEDCEETEEEKRKRRRKKRGLLQEMPVDGGEDPSSFASFGMTSQISSVGMTSLQGHSTRDDGEKGFYRYDKQGVGAHLYLDNKRSVDDIRSEDDVIPKEGEESLLKSIDNVSKSAGEEEVSGDKGLSREVIENGSEDPSSFASLTSLGMTSPQGTVGMISSLSSVGMTLHKHEGFLAKASENAEAVGQADSDSNKPQDCVIKPLSGEYHTEEALHSFRSGVDVVSPAYYAGRVIVDETKQNVQQGDQNYRAGQRELRRFSAPVLETVAVMGVVAQVSAIWDDMEDAFKAVSLVEARGIYIDDLDRPRKELKKELANIPIWERHIILKHAETVADLHAVHSALEKREWILSPEMKKLLHDREVFDLRNKKCNDMLKVCLKYSENDVLRNAGVAGMKSRDIKRLLRKYAENGGEDPSSLRFPRDDKGVRSVGMARGMGKKSEIGKDSLPRRKPRSGKGEELSREDKAVLRLLFKQKKLREARQRVNVMRNLKRYSVLAARRLVNADDNIVAGISAAQRTAIITQGIYSTASAGVKAGVLAHRVWTEYGIIGRYVGAGEQFVIKKAADGSRLVFVKTSRGIRRLKASAVRAIDSTKPVQDTRRAIRTVKEAVSHTEAVKKIRETRRAVRRAQAAAAAKKAAVRKMASRIRDGTRVVFTPFRVVRKAFARISTAISSLYKGIIAVFFGVIIVYAIIVILLNGILSVFSIEGNAVMNVILCNDEDYVQKTIGELQGHFEKKKEEALAIATGTPQNPEVFYGHTISRYGAPQADGSWTDGFKIYYRDMDGNIIENGVNNIKDVIVLAYVIMDGDFDTDPAARDALIGDLWELMNPGVTWEETDIYTADAGDDSYSYCCDNASDYEEMEDMQKEGVRFFGNIRPYSSDGCKGDEDDRYCGGHEVDVCYGHKDINVYITVGFMEDMFEKPDYPTGEAYQKYLDAFIGRGGFTEDIQEWANALYASSWFDLYGSDPAGGTGFSVADTLTPEEIASITERRW